MVAPVQPDAKAISYLKSHPETADQFNKFYGPNASERFLGQVTSTVKPDIAGTGTDILKSTGRATGEMVAGLVAQAQPSPLYAQGFNETDPTFQDVAAEAAQSGLNAPNAVGLGGVMDYEPQTIPGKAAYYATPYMPLLAGAAMGGRPFLGSVAALAGGGTEAALTEGLGLPPEVGRVAGGLASVVAGAPLLRKPLAARLASDALEGIPPQRISDAVSLQRQSVDEGVPLMAPEALNEPAVIGLADATSTYPGAGAPYHTVAREREGLARRAIQSKLDQTGAANVSPGAASTEMTGAAESIIGTAKDTRTQTAQAAGYSNLPKEDVDPAGLTDLVSQVDATLAHTAGLTGLKPLLQKFRTQLFEKDGTTPITNAAYLESAYKQLREGLNRRTSGALVSPDDAISAEDAGKVGPLIDKLQEVLQTAPSYEPGRSTFEDISKTVVDPLKERLEPIIGSNGWKQLRTVMLSPDSLTEAELTPLLQTIEKKSPTAIPNIARVIFERAYDMAFRQRKGKTPPSSPAAFVDALRNNGIQRKKFEAVVSSVARSQGQKPDIVVRGWNRLLDVLQRTATMPDIGSRTQSRAQIHRKAEQTIVSEFDLTSPGRMIERMTGSYNMKKLGRILASSNGVEGLIDLANTKPNTARAVYIANALLQSARVLETPGTEQ